MNEKERRNKKIMVAGSQNEESRLKVEEIKVYQKMVEDDKYSSIFHLILAGVYSIILLLVSNSKNNGTLKDGASTILILLGSANILRSIVFALECRKNKKTAYKLEEEILNPVKK